MRDRLLARSRAPMTRGWTRSEEHTSELQSLRHLVCRLLLEKKKTDSIPAYACRRKRTSETPCNPGNPPISSKQRAAAREARRPASYVRERDCAARRTPPARV